MIYNGVEYHETPAGQFTDDVWTCDTEDEMHDYINLLLELELEVETKLKPPTEYREADQ